VTLASDIIVSTTKKGAVDMPRKPVIDLMTLKDIGEYFGFTRENARMYLHRNKFPHAKQFGGVWVIPRADVKRYEEERLKQGLKGRL